MKYVLVLDGKIEVYQPRIDQVTVYDPGKNRDTVESFMVLGFGGGGHDMLKSFDVKYLGTETLSGSETAKLDLPRKPRMSATALLTSCSGSIWQMGSRCSRNYFSRQGIIDSRSIQT